MSSQSVCILCVDSKIVHTSRVPGLGHCTVAPNNTGQQHSPFFFLAHEGKYLILIELLTLKSNMQAVFLRRPQFFSGIQFKCERNVYIYILHTLFTLPKMCGLLISFCAWHLEIPLYRPTIVRKYSCTPLSLVPLFQGRNILVETFPVFVTDGTKIVREEIQVGVKEMYLEGHITHNFLV